MGESFCLRSRQIQIQFILPWAISWRMRLLSNRPSTHCTSFHRHCNRSTLEFMRMLRQCMVAAAVIIVRATPQHNSRHRAHYVIHAQKLSPIERWRQWKWPIIVRSSEQSMTPQGLFQPSNGERSFRPFRHGVDGGWSSARKKNITNKVLIRRTKQGRGRGDTVWGETQRKANVTRAVDNYLPFRENFRIARSRNGRGFVYSKDSACSTVVNESRNLSLLRNAAPINYTPQKPL